MAAGIPQRYNRRSRYAHPSEIRLHHHRRRGHQRFGAGRGRRHKHGRFRTRGIADSPISSEGVRRRRPEFSARSWTRTCNQSTRGYRLSAPAPCCRGAAPKTAFVLTSQRVRKQAEAFTCALLFKRSTALIKYDFAPAGEAPIWTIVHIAASASGGAVSEERQIAFPWDETYFDSP